MRFSRFARVLVAGAFVATSCGTQVVSDVTATAPDDGLATSTMVDEADATVPLPARLRLVDSGVTEGPTIVLANQVPDGAAWSGTLVSRFDSSIDGQDMPPAPLIELGVELAVKQVADDRWEYVGSYPSVELADANGADPAAVEQTLEFMRPITQISYRSEVDQFGLWSNTRVEGMENLDPVLRSLMEPSLDQFVDSGVPIPPGPLGVGATWTDTLSLEVLGDESTTEVTYVLTEIDGTRYTLTTSTVQTTVGAGIVSSTSVGSGTIIGDVTEPLPLRSELNTMSTAVYGDGTTEQTVILELSMVIEGS